MDDNIKSFNKNSKLELKVGGVFIEILDRLDLIKHDFYKGRNKSVNIITIPDNINKLLEKRFIYSVPPKLPMIVPPKKYDINESGGYILNGIDYQENLIIDKNAYKIPSKISKSNVIYNMVNNLNKTAFKINTKVLEFLIDKGEQYDIIMSTDIYDKFEALPNKTKYQNNKFKSQKSSLELQDNIL